VLGLIAGVVGVVLGMKSNSACDQGEANNKGMAIAGLVCGGIGVFFGLAYIILMIIGIAAS